jgi:hypothetical protein
MATYQKNENGVSLVTDPITLNLGGLEVVVQSVFTIVEGEGKIITERRILNDIGNENVTFEEYFTGAFGTTEYQADMSDLTLAVDNEEMQYSYLGRKITKANGECARVTVPEVLTRIEMGGDNDEAEVEEGIAFSPVYRLTLRKTVQKGGMTTWLKLQKAN